MPAAQQGVMMAPKSHRKQDAVDRELDVWLEHAMGVRHPDPEPVLHELDD